MLFGNKLDVQRYEDIITLCALDVVSLFMHFVSFRALIPDVYINQIYIKYIAVRKTELLNVGSIFTLSDDCSKAE